MISRDEYLKALDIVEKYHEQVKREANECSLLGKKELSMRSVYNHEHATKSGLKATGSKIGTSKLDEISAHAIKYFLNKGYSHSELAIAFRVSKSTISLISKGLIWSHVLLVGKELEVKL